MLYEIVVMFIRAAATKIFRETRQFWLYGLKPGDPLLDKYCAASRIAWKGHHIRRCKP